jgi:quinol monooxygenase YgiN
MNARLTMVHTLPDKMDEALAIYRDSVVPEGMEQKGCLGLYLLMDRTTGKSISISLWESEADMAASEDSNFYQQQVDLFKDVFSAPPVREAYEVSVQAPTLAPA